MRRILLLAALVLAVFSAMEEPAFAAPPVLNPKLAKTQEAVAKHMSDETLNLDQAAVVSAELLKADPGNALNHYAAARLAAWQEKWDDVAAEIEAGNKAPHTIHYQRVGGPGEMFPLNVTMRQLARAVSGGATKMGPEKAVPLLYSFRTLTRKLAWSEPRSVLSLLVVAGIRSIASNGLVTLHAPGSPEAAEAQKALDADRAFAKKMLDDGRRVFGEDFQKLAEIAAKHKVTVEQMRAYAAGGKIPPAVRAKMPVIDKEMRAFERPWIARWLKQLPE